jgi:hypothetical protein
MNKGDKGFLQHKGSSGGILHKQRRNGISLLLVVLLILTSFVPVFSFANEDTSNATVGNPPVLTVGNPLMYTYVGPLPVQPLTDSELMTSVSAIDEEDGDITDLVEFELTDSIGASVAFIDKHAKGIYYATYHVTDSDDNTASLRRGIVILETIIDSWPVIAIDARNYLIRQDAVTGGSSEILSWSFARAIYYESDSDEVVDLPVNVAYQGDYTLGCRAGNYSITLDTVGPHDENCTTNITAYVTAKEVISQSLERTDYGIGANNIRIDLATANAVTDAEQLRHEILTRSGAEVFKLHTGAGNADAIIANFGGIDAKRGKYTAGDEFTVRIAVDAEQGTYVDIKVIVGERAISIPPAVKSPNNNPGVQIALTGAQATKLANVQWTGRQIRPVVRVTLSGKTLAAGNYTLNYGANRDIGKGTITIVGIGSYKGTKTVTFKIVPRQTAIAKATVGKRLIKATWKKEAAAQKVNGYEIRYKAAKSKTWKKKTVSAKSSKLTIKKLKTGKTYKLQIRAYKSVSGVKYYAPWSAAKKSKKVK